MIDPFPTLSFWGMLFSCWFLSPTMEFWLAPSPLPLGQGNAGVHPTPGCGAFLDIISPLSAVCCSLSCGSWSATRIYLHDFFVVCLLWSLPLIDLKQISSHGREHPKLHIKPLTDNYLNLNLGAIKLTGLLPTNSFLVKNKGIPLYFHIRVNSKGPFNNLDRKTSMRKTVWAGDILHNIKPAWEHRSGRWPLWLLSFLTLYCIVNSASLQNYTLCFLSEFFWQRVNGQGSQWEFRMRSSWQFYFRVVESKSKWTQVQWSVLSWFFSLSLASVI